jgi:predicted  nucleic acid-binding Zn-ribbon protein
MASRKTSPPKPAKAAVKPRPAKEIVKDLRTGLKDLQAIDPEHPWARLLNEAVAAIRDDHLTFVAIIREVHAASAAGLAEVTREHREGMVQARGELEQIRTHLARLIDAGIRERSRDDRIETQLTGINERLRERSRGDRVIHHGKMVTAEEPSRELDATERAKSTAEEFVKESDVRERIKDKEIKGLRCELSAMERAKAEEIATLRDEVERLRIEVNAARATSTVLGGMAADPLDHRRMPAPRRSWRTTAAEGATAAPLD